PRAAARRAIAGHLIRRGVAARVEACPENLESQRVIYELPEPRPSVSIIIPTRDRAELLERCLASIREETDYAPTEIVIVDNGSTESAALELLRREERRGDVRVVRDNGAFNYSRLINRGVSAAWGEVLALLNNDMEANEPGWLREMVSHAMRVGIGAVGARLWNTYGKFQERSGI